MDRKLFKRSIRQAGSTPFACPRCGKANLRIRKGTFHYKESKQSALAHQHDAWSPDWIEYIYSCLLECESSACQEIVASSGNGSVSEYYFYDEEGNADVTYTDEFYPNFFQPHLKLFSLPKETPDEVVDEIHKSFAAFFYDPSAAAGHVRTALEHLLTHLKVQRSIKKTGKRKYLTLHNRIELLSKKFDHIKDLFFAVKWLGNAGSHSRHEITKDDVLDSYELLDELLSDLFVNRRKKAKALAKQIIKKRGPK